MFKVQKHIHVEALRKFRERLKALNKYPTLYNLEERDRLASIIATYERLGKGTK